MEDLTYLPSERRILPNSQNCQVVLPICWRLVFVVLAKILGCQILLAILGFLSKLQKTASNKLVKLLGNFVSLAKFSLHLANMPSPPSLVITCIPICQLVLPTCWRLNFMILVKILGCQVLLASPNNNLLEKTSFFTWHLVLRLGKTIDLLSEF